MKAILFSAVLLTAGSSWAIADPVKMTDEQLDKVTAGQLIEVSENNIVVAVPVNANVQACVIVEACQPSAGPQSAAVNNRARFD